MYQTDNLVQYRGPDHRPLERVLTTTEEMLARAEASDWEGVDALRLQRSDELESYIDNNPNWHATQQASTTLVTLLVLNDELVNRVAQARQQVYQETQSLQANKAAANNYRDVQAGSREV